MIIVQEFRDGSDVNGKWSLGDYLGNFQGNSLKIVLYYPTGTRDSEDQVALPDELMNLEHNPDMS